MNRQSSAVLFAIALLSLAAWTGCSGVSKTKSTPSTPVPASISATAGATQSATEGTPFSALTVTVLDATSKPVSGVSVAFTAPSSGASGTFANSSATETDKTNASGVATSSTFTANGTAGSYTVTATVSGVSSAARFALTNTAPPPASISASGGATQSATAGAAFAAPLSATVLDAHSHPVAGASVIFTAPSSGASGTFANSSPTETDTTNASGVATSSTFTANATAGSYTVTAAVSGVSSPADFALTNNPANLSFVFYLYGTEYSAGDYMLGLVGSVIIDPSGNVLSGEQDFNDAAGLTSPEPSGDAITGGSLSVDPTTGQGTLTLVTNNSNLGVSGTETLGVQFVNAKHARVITFDGTGTSSGSMDAQTLPTALSGSFAFAYAGVDNSYNAASIGGVFSVSGTAITNGIADQDAGGSVVTGIPFSATISAADSHGRGSFTLDTTNFVYYEVGPEVLRVIDVDQADALVGSAYGQGASAGTFGNASLGQSVLGTSGNTFEYRYSWVAQITPGSGATFTGYGDDNEQGYGGNGAISGTYAVASNGYGGLSTSWDFQSQIGIYMTDPNLNLLDPNNTTSGLGGALVVDLDTELNGIGFATPQTDTSTADFTGNYVFAMQNTDYYEYPFDYVGQGTVTSLALSGTGLLSDPFNQLMNGPADTGVGFSSTFLPDGSNPGRYSLNLLALQDPSANLDVVAYQASGTQVYWLDENATVIGFGFLEQQSSLTGVPGLSPRQAPAAPQQKKPSTVR